MLLIMMNEILTISIAEDSKEGERILQLDGPLTIKTLFDFRDAIRAEKTAKTVILDFSKVPYMDSAGVGALVNAHVSCLNSSRRLALVAVQDRIRTLMKVTHVEEVLKMYPTLQEARAAEAH